ncbi:MAG: invasion associated locus B family protein [Paracoccus sp. (in: a-proteobacteria)]|uniref:invasion associated locus B family protein n=1 Tax=Paracoccus sp. TaxID=267 RepID=UPI0026E0833A|nr:invasion associated locus B family protein [Paracoccus sp. (in: a-proteobacteria)]MDO5612241.1 invasion associated locus B family protein [Paracoccus sp. (in: a-proteobacteria)]
MVIKASPALVAAMLLIAAPAVAQDTATTDTDQASESTSAADVQGAEGTQSGAATDAPADAAAKTPAETPAETAPAGDAAAGAEGAAGTQSGAAPQAETTPAETAEPAAPAETDQAAAPAPEAAPAEPQLGAYYVKSTQTDWTVRCINTENPVDPCEMYQLLRDEGGNSVAEVTMIPLPQGGQVAAGATMVAPLETDLIAGLTVRVDQGQARSYPFNLCTSIGCVSRIGFTQAELDQLRRGRAATISLVPFGGDPRNPVSLNMSLSGFTAAINELAENASAAEAANAAAPAAEAPAEAAPAGN